MAIKNSRKLPKIYIKEWNITVNKNSTIFENINTAISACAQAWAYFILLEEAKAMSIVIDIIDLLDRVIKDSSDIELLQNYNLEIIKLLPTLLTALENKNGIFIADTLEYELKLILENMNKVYFN